MDRRDGSERYSSPMGGAAGVVMLLAAWLPWVKIAFRVGPLPFSVKISGFSSWHGKVTVVCGLALVAAAVIRRVETSTEWRRAMAWAAMAAGFIALGPCIHVIVHAHPVDATEQALHGSITLGIGLYLTLAGAAAGVASGVLAAMTPPAATAVAAFPAGSVSSAPLPPWETASPVTTSDPSGSSR